MIAELVDIGPRPTVMALGSVANWSCNFVVGTCFPTLNHLIGENAFLIFASFTTLLCIFLLWVLEKYMTLIWNSRRILYHILIRGFDFSMYLPETSTQYEHALSAGGEDDDEWDENKPRTVAEANHDQESRVRY